MSNNRRWLPKSWYIHQQSTKYKIIRKNYNVGEYLVTGGNVYDMIQDRGYHKIWSLEHYLFHS